MNYPLAWQVNPNILPLIPATLLSLWVGWVAWKRRTAHGARSLAVLMVMVSAWAAANALDVSSATIPQQIFFSKFEYLGITTIPTLWLLFTISYTQQNGRLRRHRWLLALEPLVILILVWTNESHRLIWSEVIETRLGSLVMADFHYGIAFWAHTVYSYLMLLFGVMILLQYMRQIKQVYRRQVGIILVSLVFPWVGNLLYVTGNNPLSTVDLTPIAFFLTGLLMTWGMFYYRLVDLAPVAREIVLDNLDTAVLVLDEKGRFVDYNPAASQYFHLTPERTLSQPASEVLPYLGELLDNLEPHASREAEINLDSSQGAGEEPAQVSTLVVRISPILNPHGETLGWVITAYDLTRRKAIEAELRAAKETAETASQAKSLFLANISHELRTPLSAILGFGEMIQDQMDAEHPQRGRLDKMMQSADQLHSLIDELLDFSQLDSNRLPLHPKAFPLQPFLEDLCAGVRPWMESNHNRFEVVLQGQLGNLHTDEKRLGQILTNLLHNAAKFTHNGMVRLEVSNGNRRVEFRISDTGIGIPAEALEAIFQPFTQANSTGEAKPRGVGLGLSICKELTHLLGGQISVASQPGSGSTFTLSLPVENP